MSAGAVIKDLKEYHTEKTVSIVRSQEQINIMRVIGKVELRSNQLYPTQ